MKKVRLEDIANRLGVSVGSVSRALAGKPGPGETLRAEILRVAGSMGWSVKGPRADGVLRTASVLIRQSYLLDSNNDFFNAVYDGVRREAAAQGVILSGCLIDSSDSAPETVAGRLRESDGVLALGVDSASWRAALRALGKPVVLCCGHDPDMRLDSVSPAWRDGARIATAHMIGLGHRRILFIGALDRTASRRRLEGYFDALREAGIGVDQERDVIDVGDASAEAVRAAALGPLRGRIAAASAAFCAPDSAAMGLISACLESGIAVPQALSVVGFDDMPTAALFHPGVTTVHVRREELGRVALRRLIARARNPSETARRIDLGGHLVERGSTAKA